MHPGGCTPAPRRTRSARSPSSRPARSSPRRERAALSFAEALTITGQKVTEELFARVRAHYSEAETVELAAAIAVENFRSKFNVALGVEAQGFCVLP